MIFVRSCKIQMRSKCQQFYSNSMYLSEEWWLSCENWESTGASLLFNAERGSDSWSWVFGVSGCLCTAWVDGIQSLSWIHEWLLFSRIWLKLFDVSGSFWFLQEVSSNRGSLTKNTNSYQFWEDWLPAASWRWSAVVGSPGPEVLTWGFLCDC